MRETRCASIRPRAVGAVAAVVLAAVGVVPADAAQPAATVVLRYSFDRADAGMTDESGHGHVLRPEAAAGGTTRMVPRGAGWAVAFPARCSAKRCPRAVLRVPHRGDLNPGDAEFGYGATVRLARDQTTKGQNVLQKGYAANGSQYKLQIDGAAGLPSCVLVDRRRPTIRLAKGTRTVADGAWHAVSCHRTRTALTIVVDGAVRGRTRLPAELSVVNTVPLSIGGKGAYQDNDQFQGAVDDVWVSVS